MAVFNRVKAFVVRAFLLLHFALVVWRVTVSWSEHYWLLGCAILPFVIEGIYTIIKRAGLEWRLFSLCFFFYLCATLPGIWLLEIKKTITYQDYNNLTRVEDIIVSGVEIPVRLSPNTWVLVTEEMMLYLMILGRWLLPRGGVGREQLTQLLFGFVGIASDIMELFSLFDEDPGVRHNTLLTYLILGVWSVSVFQFTLTFATAHRPRRARGIRMSNVDEHRHQRRSVLRVELLATFLSMLMQDGPFLALRLYTMITFQVITYSLVFFTSKNVLVIFLLVYKIFLLLGKLCCPKSQDDQDEDEEEEDDEEEKDDVFLGPYGSDMMVKEAGPVRHINGRVMHPASRMPQFVNIRNRRPDDGVKLNPLYAGQDKYTRQIMGDLQRIYGNRRIGELHRNDGHRNLADVQRTVANRHVVDLQGNVANRHDGHLQRPQGGQNVAEPPKEDASQVIGDLQKAIEGPATPAKKMVRNKKHLPKESAKNGTGDETPKPDISIISSNDLTGNLDITDPQDDIHSEFSPNADNEAVKEVKDASPDNDEEFRSASSSDLDQPLSDGQEASFPGDAIALVGTSEEGMSSPGWIPTNGAVNALIVATGEWEEGGEE